MGRRAGATLPTELWEATPAENVRPTHGAHGSVAEGPKALGC